MHLSIEIALSNCFPSIMTNLRLWEILTIPFWWKHSTSEIKLSEVIWERLKQIIALNNVFLWSNRRIKRISAYFCTTKANAHPPRRLWQSRGDTLHTWTRCWKFRPPFILLTLLNSLKTTSRKVIWRNYLCVLHHDQWKMSHPRLDGPEAIKFLLKCKM